MTFTCDICGASFSRKFNLKRHQTSRCKSTVVMNTCFNDAADAVKENDVQQPKDSQWPSFINDIMNKEPDSGNATIQSLKPPTMSYAAEKILDTSLSKKSD